MGMGVCVMSRSTYYQQIVVNELIMQALDLFTLPIRTRANNNCFDIDCRRGNIHSHEVEIAVPIAEAIYMKCEYIMRRSALGSAIGKCEGRSEIAMVGFEHVPNTANDDRSTHTFRQSKLIDLDTCLYVYDNIGYYCLKHYKKIVAFTPDSEIIE